MIEDWRTVPGTNGRYEIILDVKEGRCRNTLTKKELSNTPSKRDGRIIWSLCIDGKKINHQSAVWIAMTFPELVQNKYFDGAEIDHIDTDPTNNNPSNLRWVDRHGQMNNPLTLSHLSESHRGKTLTEEHRKKLSEANKNCPSKSRWVIKLSNNNEILHFYPSAKQAERETGVYNSNINKCCNGKLKTAGGYKWKYVE